MKKNIFIYTVFCLFVSLFNISCNDINNVNYEQCVISFYTGIEERTAFPIVQTSDFNKLALYGKKTDSTGDLQLIKLFDSVIQLENSNIVIDCGKWNFKLIGYINNSSSEDGTVYSCVIDEREIIPGLNLLRFDLALDSYDLSTGKGSFALEIDYDEEEPVRKVTAILKKFDETEDIVFDVEELTISAKEDEWLKSVYYQKINIPAGIYKAEFIFYGDDEKNVIINEYSICCYVVKNLLTRQTVELELFDEIYNVTYHWNGGILNSNEYLQTSFSRKNEFTLPVQSSLYKRGYVFDGWFESETFDGEAVTKINKSTTRNIELYAKWTPKKYNITLKARNDEEITGTNLETASLEHTYGNETELPVLEKFGYNFKGWYLDSLCQKDSFSVVASNAVIQDTTYYALFEPKEYSIIYLNEGANAFIGTLPDYAPQVHYYSITTALVNPYNSERSFVGWYRDPTCMGTAVTSIDGMEVINDNKIYLYAKWEESISAYVSELDAKLAEINKSENYNKIYTLNIKNPDIDGDYSEQNLESILNKYSNLNFRINFTLLDSFKNTSFNGLDNIVSVTFPKNINTYDKFIFSSCTNLINVRLPENVTRIENDAFMGCSSLESFDFTEGIEYIGSNAFKGCKKLYDIYLPDSLTSLGNYAFNGCMDHYGQTIKKGSIYTKSEFLNVFEAYKDDLLTDITVEISQNENEIADERFYGWISIVKVITHNGITSIGNKAFSGCIKLTDISIPENLTELGESAFFNCGEITSLIIPSGVNIINDNTFNGCVKLESIELPSGITSLGIGAFNGCESLEEIKIPKMTTTIGINCFTKCTNLSKVEFENGSILNKINSYAFSGCLELTSISIPDTVDEIGEFAFNLCSKLTSVTLPSGLKVITKDMFNQCSSLTSIDLPDEIETINECAFQLCTSLEKLILKENVTKIDSNIVFGCTSLSEIEIHTTVVENETQKMKLEISDNAFAGCKENCKLTFYGDHDSWNDIVTSMQNEYADKLVITLKDN